MSTAYHGSAMNAAVPPRIDLCSVQRDGEDVVLHFGCLDGSELAPGALAPRLQQRVRMSAGGAAKLQDLLLELLREQPSPGAEAPR